MKALFVGAALVAATLVSADPASAGSFERHRGWSNASDSGHAVRWRDAHRGYDRRAYRGGRHQAWRSANSPQRTRVVRRFQDDGDRYKVVRSFRGDKYSGRASRKVFRNGDLVSSVRKRYGKSQGSGRTRSAAREVRRFTWEGDRYKVVNTVRGNGKRVRTSERTYRNGDLVHSLRTRSSVDGRGSRFRNVDRYSRNDRRWGASSREVAARERWRRGGRDGRRGGQGPRVRY